MRSHRKGYIEGTPSLQWERNDECMARTGVGIPPKFMEAGHYYITNPLLIDTDNDGLWDSTEINSKNFKTQDNIQVDLEIPMGNPPNPYKRDLYIEVDWMEIDQTNTNKMTTTTKEIIEEYMANVGINVHFDLNSPLTRISPIDLDAFDLLDAYYTNVDIARRGIFYYILMADRFDPQTYVWGNSLGPAIIIQEGKLRDYLKNVPDITEDQGIAIVILHEIGHCFFGDIDPPSDRYGPGPNVYEKVHDKYIGFLMRVFIHWFYPQGYHPNRWIEVAAEGMGNALYL